MLADGVLLTGFGGPDCPDAVGPFMRNLTGRDPDPATLERVRARYERGGGCSPLVQTARELALAVESALEEMGREVPVEVGMRYWQTTIAEGIERLAERGARCVAHVSLSPIEAAVTHARYREAIDAALSGIPHMAVCDAPQLSTFSAYRDLHARALRQALAAVADGPAFVAFTAHSLPASDEGAARYDRELRAVADVVATSAGLASGHDVSVAGATTWGDVEGATPWAVCYQSKGARGGAWLGPDLEDVIPAAAGLGARAIVIAPVGFALDHMETLYDLDVAAKERAERAGVRFVRARVPNAHPALARAIAEVVLGTGCGQG
jgi:ferrochelatase